MIAIDLGSNTIRFIEYDGVHWGNRFEKIVRAAESLHDTGMIGENAIVRILNAIDEAHAHLDFSNQEIVAVTTAAVRMAANAHEVLDRIHRQSGIRFTIIDGDTEAKLTLLAVQNRLNQLNLTGNRFILADIGGGSTELIYVDHGNTNATSLGVGIVTMSEKAADELELHHLLDAFEEQVREYINSVPIKEKLDMLVLTAGTPTTIAAYRMGMNYTSYNPEKINGYKLTDEDCLQTYTELMDMEESQRAYYVGVGRERLIATGIMMVHRLFKGVNLFEAIIVDDSLREGVAINYFNSTPL